ncbi:hypothetical protein AsACE_CH01116 [Acinetobacter schindleri]|nr:hypothetical protein AsACE_CH01116 [Acinetobacter schindleri]
MIFLAWSSLTKKMILVTIFDLKIKNMIAACMCSHPQHIQSIISSVYHLYRQYKQDIYHG